MLLRNIASCKSHAVTHTQKTAFFYTTFVHISNHPASQATATPLIQVDISHLYSRNKTCSVGQTLLWLTRLKMSLCLLITQCAMKIYGGNGCRAPSFFTIGKETTRKTET
jgi:hypothetical protein